MLCQSIVSGFVRTKFQALSMQVPKRRSVLAGEIASSKALSITGAGQSSAGARQGSGVERKYAF